MEDENVAGIEIRHPFFISHVIVDAQREAHQLELLTAAIPVQQRLRLSGVGHAQFARGLSPGGKAESHEAAFDAAFADQLIELAQKFRRQEFLRSDAAQNTDSHGAIKGGSGTFAADDAQAKADPRRAIAQEVIKVTADFARGKDSRGQVNAKILRRNGPQQGALHALAACSSRSIRASSRATFSYRRAFSRAMASWAARM